MIQDDLATQVKFVLEDEYGCDTDFIYEKGDYLYFWADHKFLQYPYLVRVEKEYFTTNHEYKQLHWDDWKKLSVRGEE